MIGNFKYPMMPLTGHFDSVVFRKIEKDPNWIAERKLNGWRVWVIKNGDNVEIWNRKGARIDDPLPTLREPIRHLPYRSVWLDAELIWSKRMTGVTDGLYLLDLVNIDKSWFDSLHENKTLLDRRTILIGLWDGFLQKEPQITIPIWISSYGMRDEYLQILKEDGFVEGLVCKNLDSPYVLGKTKSVESFWVKFRKPDTHIKTGKGAK